MTLSLLLLAVLPASAQDWELFPLGQRSAYVDSTQNPVSVETLTMDSVYQSGDAQTMYFNSAFKKSVFADCTSWEGESSVGPAYSYGIDSLVALNDTVYYTTEGSTSPFYFLPLATVGQSWPVVSIYWGNDYTTITITCISMGLSTFMGVTDSVKIFSLTPNGSSSGQAPISDQQFVLSKSRGLLHYVPFSQFLIHPSYTPFGSRELIGLQVGAVTAGYRQPSFSDYFHLSVGDLRAWKVLIGSDWYGVPDQYEYLADSITAVVNTPDSVIYTFDRTYYQSDGSILQLLGSIERYVKRDLNAMVTAPTHEFTLGHGFVLGTYGSVQNDTEVAPAIWMSGPIVRSVDPSELDTITSFTLTNGGDEMDTASCTLIPVSDIYREVHFDTRAGLTMKSVDNIGPWTQTLIGYRIDGVSEGDLSVGIIEDRTISHDAMSVLPNPSQESILLQGIPQGAAGQFTVYDGLGRAVMHGALPVSSLSVEGLQQSVYVVQVRLLDRIVTARFVKE